MKFNLLVVILLVTFHHGDSFPLASEYFSHNVTLKPPNIFRVLWKFDNSTITFEIQVKTKSWVGFGLSGNGGMKNSDVIIGKVKQDGIFFEVRKKQQKVHR